MRLIAYLPEPPEVIARALENAILEAGYRVGQAPREGFRTATLEVEPLPGGCRVRFQGIGVPLDTVLTLRPEAHIHWCERGSVYESYRAGRIVESLCWVFEGEPECCYDLEHRLTVEDGAARLRERFPPQLVHAPPPDPTRQRLYLQPTGPPVSWADAGRWLLELVLGPTQARSSR